MRTTFPCLLLILGFWLPDSAIAQTEPNLHKNQRISAFSGKDLQRYVTEASQVTIIRDKWGIPHIYGKTDAAVVFGLLYAECQEDFPRVEKNYLEMLGRQAEAYGENYVNQDVMMRLIYDSVQAIKDYENSPSWLHKLLDAFADGVNYYLYKHPECRPLALQRFEPWYALMFTDGSVSATSTGGIRPEEISSFYSRNSAMRRRKTTAIEKMVLADRGMLAPEKDDSGKDDSGKEEKTKEGKTKEEKTNETEKKVETKGGIAAEQERETGSNGFAVAPSRTASGNAMLYINPHVPFYFRMEVQLVSEEGLNAYGAVTWGQFFVYQGFNAHCGWMHTSSYADVADLYEEKVSQSDKGRVYEYEGQLRPVTTRQFNIYYKKGELEESGLFPLTGYYTHHGPVMGIRNGKWLSLREFNRSLSALEEAWQITKAGTLDEFKKAMELRANTTNNTVYADDQGNIAYWHGNFMPRRDMAYDWSLPVDGSIAATEWKGLHALDEIVHVNNPATGWIQNCNSTPFTISGSSSPVRNQYPAYMAPDGQNFRALNAIRLFSTADHLTLDSLIKKGYDRYLSAFDTLLPALLKAYNSKGNSPANEAGVLYSKSVEEAISILQQWDRKCGEHSVATTLAVEWAGKMVRYAPRPKTSEDATNALTMVQGEIANSTAEQKLDELSAVISSLQERFGDWKIEWGTINRYQRLTGKIMETYDDNSPSLPSGLVSSGLGALPSFQSKLMPGTKLLPGTKKRYGYSGNSFIAAVEFGKKVTAKTIITGGESSDPRSPHFSDQALMYLDGAFKDVSFYKEDVLRNKEKQYHPGEE